MSLSSQSFALPHAAARHAFEAAARAHQAARQITGAHPFTPAAPAPSSVEGAIANAARQTGVDFEFLLAQAQVESALDPAAKARTSSASGLYQFIESTWLDTMKRHGARFGLGALAENIAVGANGAAYVADPAQRAEILGLRHDPQIAAWMAAGLAEDNAAHLMPVLGRQPDHGELYLAHFLGAGGAARFLSAMQDNPGQSAASLFPKAASANRAIFYEPGGSARSLAGVMHNLGGKMARAMGLAPRGMGGPTFAHEPAFASYAPARPSAYSPVPAAGPYLIADEAVFMPLSAPLVTGGGAAPSASASASARAPLSDVLGAALGAASAAGASAPRAAAQVRRAYQQFKALGL